MCVERMQRGVDLNGRAKAAVAADAYTADIEYHAIEVEEDITAQLDVGAVVAEKGRLDDDGISSAGEELFQVVLPSRMLCFGKCVDGLTQVTCSCPGRCQFWVGGVVELSCHHFFEFRLH